MDKSNFWTKNKITLLKLQRKGNTFSLIPKINILNKLFTEIKFLIIIARTLLRIRQDNQGDKSDTRHKISTQDVNGGSHKTLPHKSPTHTDSN